MRRNAMAEMKAVVDSNKTAVEALTERLEAAEVASQATEDAQAMNVGAGVGAGAGAGAGAAPAIMDADSRELLRAELLAEVRAELRAEVAEEVRRQMMGEGVREVIECKCEAPCVVVSSATAGDLTLCRSSFCTMQLLHWLLLPPPR